MPNISMFDIRVPYLMTEIHLDIETELSMIPQKNGNPIPGKFMINEAFSPGIMDKTYEIDILPGWMGHQLLIAAHAVVGGQGGMQYLENALPATATISVSYPYEGGPSYFPQTIITNGGMLNGQYEGWCIDTDHTISQGIDYPVNVYSSYEALPAGLVERPENMDLVNWILNQNFVGKPSTGIGSIHI